MSNSPYIEASKHPELTKMVEDHFMTSHGPNTGQMSPSDVKGDNSRNALPPRADDYPFNVDTGVNYVPPSRAGHKV
jgi:hypothetical protein